MRCNGCQLAAHSKVAGLGEDPPGVGGFYSEVALQFGAYFIYF